VSYEIEQRSASLALELQQPLASDGSVAARVLELLQKNSIFAYGPEPDIQVKHKALDPILTFNGKSFLGATAWRFCYITHVYHCCK
jgi:hypothetical protein